MDLAAFQTTMTSWVEAHSTLELEWGRMPQKMYTGPFILAALGAITKQGHDERIQSYVEATDSTAIQVVGVRQATLRLSFRSDDQRLGFSARQFAENFRVGIHAQTSFDTLYAAELALIDTGELIDTDYVWSGRMMSQTDMDLTIGLRAFITDPDHDGSYIFHANINSQGYVIDEDGVVVVDEDGDYVSAEPGTTFSVN